MIAILTTNEDGGYLIKLAKQKEKLVGYFGGEKLSFSHLTFNKEYE